MPTTRQGQPTQLVGVMGAFTGASDSLLFGKVKKREQVNSPALNWYFLRASQVALARKFVPRKYQFSARGSTGAGHRWWPPHWQDLVSVFSLRSISVQLSSLPEFVVVCSSVSWKFCRFLWCLTAILTNPLNLVCVDDDSDGDDCFNNSVLLDRCLLSQQVNANHLLLWQVCHFLFQECTCSLWNCVPKTFGCHKTNKKIWSLRCSDKVTTLIQKFVDEGPTACSSPSLIKAGHDEGAIPTAPLSANSNGGISSVIIQRPMKTIKRFSTNTDCKVVWGVYLCYDWSQKCLENSLRDQHTKGADVDKIGKVGNWHLSFALSSFVNEVKCRDGNDFPGQTLHQITVRLQFHTEGSS